jgi:hypothetical protein
MKTDLTIDDVARLDFERRMRQFAAEAADQLKQGKDLRQVSRWSYDRRESGEDVPYMSVLNRDPDGTVTCVYASPTAKQKKLKKFFDEKAPDSSMPRYTLRAVAEDGHAIVEFTEKLGRGKDNKRSLT